MAGVKKSWHGRIINVRAAFRHIWTGDKGQNTLEDARWDVTLAVEITDPGKDEGRLVFSYMTPDQAEEVSRNLMEQARVVRENLAHL